MRKESWSSGSGFWGCKYTSHFSLLLTLMQNRSQWWWWWKFKNSKLNSETLTANYLPKLHVGQPSCSNSSSARPACLQPTSFTQLTFRKFSNSINPDPEDDEDFCNFDAGFKSDFPSRFLLKNFDVVVCCRRSFCYRRVMLLSILQEEIEESFRVFMAPAPHVGYKI